MKSNKKEADEFHFVAFLKSHTSQKGLRAKVSDSQMTGGGGRGRSFVSILVKLISLVLDLKPGIWFSVYIIKQFAPLTHLANGRNRLQGLLVKTNKMRYSSTCKIINGIISIKA